MGKGVHGCAHTRPQQELAHDSLDTPCCEGTSKKVSVIKAALHSYWPVWHRDWVVVGTILRQAGVVLSSEASIAQGYTIQGGGSAILTLHSLLVGKRSIRNKHPFPISNNRSSSRLNIGTSSPPVCCANCCSNSDGPEPQPACLATSVVHTPANIDTPEQERRTLADQEVV